jgi:internalin A
MILMIELASALTLPIAKLLLKSWLGDTGADISVGLFDLGLKRLGDRAKARSAQHRAEEIADAVIANLERFFANEHVAKEKLAVAASALGDTIEQHVSATFLVNQQLNAKDIEQALLDARPVGEIYKRAESEHGLYVRLVRALAPRLRAVAPELPDYELERDAVLLRKLDEVAASAPRLLVELREFRQQFEELRKRPAHLARGFERSYLDAIVKELDYVEILGIEELDSKSRKADLTVAYLSLTARLGDGEEQQKIDFATILTLLPVFGNHLWIEGGAGSGKSTLVRWAALQAAHWRLGQAANENVLDIAPDLDNWLNFLRPVKPDERALGDEALRGKPPMRGREDGLRPADREHPEKPALREQAWRGRLPFVAFLRYATEGLSLERLPHLAVRTIATPPEGWLQEAFSDDGAGTILIFDGVDEVPAGRKREEMLGQIGNFAERFSKAQILVTSRPGAADSASLDGFQRVVLEDLSEPQKLGFIDHWHQALAANFRRKGSDAVIAQLHRAALRELERQPTLALLATNPLLCAAICALHWLSRRKVVEEAWQKGTLSQGSMQTGVLPGSLWNLCEQLTRMLVHQRDLDRELGGTAFGPAYCLSYEQKREILARIAYGMVAGDLLSAMARNDALAHVQAALERFREQIPASAENVLQALLERSGVLRGSGENSVEFVHNTLKAFLAAKFYLGLLTHDEVVRRIAAGSPEELASGLDEIAVFAAASPDHPAYAQRLVEALVLGGGSRADRRKLGILALRCEAAASSHLPQEIRARVQALAPRLFPPRDSHEARQLAALGDKAVPHLSYQRRATAAKSAAAVHCLRLIGTAGAQEAMRAYLATDSLVVAEELIPDHNPLAIAAVLKAARGGKTWREVSPTIRVAVRDLSPIANLTNLPSLNLSYTSVDDATPLTNLTNLQRLDLSSTQVADAAPLAKLVNLHSLALSYTQVEDVAPLAHLIRLQMLTLTGTMVADITPFGNLDNMLHLYLGYTAVSDLGPLIRLKNLKGLYLHDTSLQDVSPLVNLPNLEVLTLGDSQVTDISVIKALSALRRLNINNLPINPFDMLSEHRFLGELELNGTPVCDLAPLSNFANAANIESLHLSATQVSDLAPLSTLTNLRELTLRDTRVADAAPLANLINLRWLDLSGTQVADATPLANLTKLKWLNLSGTRVADATPLVNLTSLERLDLSGTRLSQDQLIELEQSLGRRGNRTIKIE